MLTLLLTRPRAASERFSTTLPRTLLSRLTIVNSPLIRIVKTAGDIDFGDARGLIFSSSNGVAIAARLSSRRDLPCFCVGQATTDAARQAGWQADCAGATSDALVSSLVETQPATPLLHIRGTHSRGHIVARLMAQKCPARAQSVYEQRLEPLTEQAQQVLAGSDAVIAPLFSPRTARQFANQHKGQAPLYLAALSEAVAEPLKSLKYIKLAIADHPDSATMAGLVEHLVNTAIRVEGDEGAQ
ncbi:MAG: uroporphyrinogen-III synthase [Paracoccaceae bacterium]|jgi:uroporphyrinogen-III synthase